MRILKIISILIFYYVTSFSFSLTPTFFEKRIDKAGGYQEFTMHNNSNKTQRFKITALPGTGKYNGDMNDWVDFSPKIITIKPQSKNTLKVFVKAPKGTEEGEYSTFLNFKSIPVPDLMRDDGKSVEAAAHMGLNVNIELIGYVGEHKAKLEINNLKVTENSYGKAVVSFNVKNNTLKRGIWYDVDVIEANGNYESIEKGRIGKGKADEVTLTMKKIKKNDVIGIRLRDSSTYEDISTNKIK